MHRAETVPLGRWACGGNSCLRPVLAVSGAAFTRRKKSGRRGSCNRPPKKIESYAWPGGHSELKVDGSAGDRPRLRRTNGAKLERSESGRTARILRFRKG